MKQEYPLQVVGDGWLAYSWHRFDDSNIDIWLDWEGATYRATLFTLEDVQSLMGQWVEDGHFTNPTFWTVDSIIIESIDEPHIRSLFDDLIRNGEVGAAMYRLPETTTDE